MRATLNALRRAYLRFRISAALNDLAWHQSQLAKLPGQIDLDQKFIDACRTELAGLEPSPTRNLTHKAHA